MTRWLEAFERNEPVQIANDLFSKPLPVNSCAQVIWTAVQRACVGTYHVAGADRVSLAHFGLMTARIFGCDEGLIEPVPSAQMTQFAPRPRDTSLVTEKMERELGIRPIGIIEGLTMMKQARVTIGKC